VLANRIVQGISNRIGIAVQPLLMIAATLFVIVLVIQKNARRSVCNGLSRVAPLAVLHLWKTIVVLALITVCYASTVMVFAIPERLGDLSPIFRYQPISKLILTPLYMVFGLHEWVGRVLQIAFTFGGAFYLYRITGLFGTQTASRAAAILYVFLPPVFHYGNTHMIEGGLLFLIIASFYHWIRYLEKSESRDLIRGTLFCTFACLYKHPAVSVIPAFAAMTAYDFLFPKPSRTRRFPWPSVIACAIPSITFLLFMKLAAFNTDTPSKVQPLNLAQNVKSIPLGDTLPIALLFLCGLIYVSVTKPFRRFVILFAWAGTHYLLVSLSSNADNVRQALPCHAGLIVMAALLLDGWPSRYLKIQSLFVYAVLPVFLLWACLFMDRRQDFRHVGRAMGDRSYITFSNWEESYLPYPAAVRWLQLYTAPGDTIYAPMANEPVHFYLAKYTMDDRNYDRKIWAPLPEQNLDSLLAHCRKIGAKWLVLPRGKWPYTYLDLEMIESLFSHAPPGYKPVHQVSSGREEIGILKIIPKKNNDES